MIDLRQGDCLDVLKDIPDGSVDMILTDPPYFCGMTHNGTQAVYNDLIVLKPFFSSLFAEWQRVLKPDGLVYMFTDWRSVAFFMPLLNNRITVKNMLVWDKAGRISPNYGFYHELILFAGNSPRKICKKNMFQAPNFNSNACKAKNGDKVHPTQKPLELLEQFIIDGSDEGDLILDCFMGSGSTGVACVNTNRKFIGIELDDGYFAIAKERVEEAQKKVIDEIH